MSNIKKIRTKILHWITLPYTRTHTHTHTPIEASLVIFYLGQAEAGSHHELIGKVKMLAGGR